MTLTAVMAGIVWPGASFDLSAQREAHHVMEDHTCQDGKCDDSGVPSHDVDCAAKCLAVAREPKAEASHPQTEAGSVLRTTLLMFGRIRPGNAIMPRLRGNSPIPLSLAMVSSDNLRP